jgi:hypothetical protein
LHNGLGVINRTLDIIVAASTSSLTLNVIADSSTPSPGSDPGHDGVDGPIGAKIAKQTS